jgi:hypothetical protein
METGVLKKLFGKGATDLDKALAAIVGLEKRYDETIEALHAAKRALQTAMEAEILDGTKAADHGKATITVAGLQAKADAIGRIIIDARGEAAKLIQAAAEGRQDRIEAVKVEISKIVASRGRRLAVAVAEFVRKHGLQVRWPKEFMGGEIGLPVLGLDPAEIEQITAKAAGSAAATDPDEAKLAALREQLGDLEAMDRQPADMALDDLLVTARGRQSA